ncbi:LOW QUALITY PROTEIN: exonuclease 1 [Sceloporus undulatus]|uniref:LOW QUALITY PROTEIN: exonuclease 1 n=1 Tax=Sceloporus undulatus TaxID=8520 RepID=UPI001C4CBE9D|nr:LOW QUALITY PROTEIN: exonuclease 1 [Sceloporus undulatus]
MGIPGLLQFIKEAAEPAHVKKYKGQVVAVDTYCWLHKGAYACAEKLAKGEPTNQYVDYCMKFVDMLLTFGVNPVLVFDGCTLPSKKEVEKSRREKRQANLLKGKQLLCEGKLSEARECFSRSINITHAMACEVIKAARAQGVDCIVAPYEADAQLAYLNKIGIAQAIITEDSDLLAFGCKKVFLKIDKFGNGLEIDQARLGMCKQLGDVFTEEKFRYMCILSGCDYLPSIHGIGLGKACKLLKIANNPDIIKIIRKMGQYLKMNILVPDDYLEGFIRANNTFLYQLVFDPVKRKLVPLNAYEDDIDPETLHYAGKHFGDSTAFQIALGNKDISTMEQIDNYNPDVSQPVQPRSRGWDDKCVNEKVSSLKSIWSKDYKPGFTAKDSRNQKPLLEKPTTRGMERLINTKGLNLPSKALLAKRPRLEELSEGDLLSQYFSNAKKSKTENKEDGEHNESASVLSVFHASKYACSNNEGSNSQPRPRNKFASILQKKNEESGAVVVPGTRSRFFCSIIDLPDSQPKNIVAQPSQDCEISEAECGVMGDHTSYSSEAGELKTTISPSLGAAQTSCFSWTKSFSRKSETLSPLPSIAFLKQFQRQTPSKDTSQNCKVSQIMSSTTSTELDVESSPLKEQGILSEPELDLSSQSNLDTSVRSPVTMKKAITGKESDHSLQPDCNLNSRVCPFFNSSSTESQETVIKSMVPESCKASSVKTPAVTRCRSLVPAKVSGLSKKSAKTKKKNHQDAENKSRLQVTINEIWKTFQFKRESPKLPSCKKTEPLSPVKDNNIQLTPDTDEDAFNKPEFSHVQRKIFQ